MRFLVDYRLILVMVLGGSALAIAQDAPAPKLEITITGVEGLAQVRDSETGRWRKCEVGMIVGAGAEFRTAAKSAVRCQIPPDQTFTVDRLGVIKVMTLLKEGNLIKTDLAMPYGRTRYDVEMAGVEHQSTIRSPSGTLAIRGTRVSLYDQPPFTPRATSLTGRAVYATAKRQMAFGGAGKAAIGDEKSAADTAAKAAQVRQVIQARTAIELTEAETRQLALDVSRGGIRFGRLIVGGFEAPPDDLAAAGLLPGKLNFTATWSGFADLDIFVILSPNTPQQQILGNPSISRLFPEVVSKTPGGGRVDFDKVSTSKGDFEVAYWPTTTYKPGVYGIGVIHHDFRNKDPRYDATSNVKIEVYQNGKKIDGVLTNPEAFLGGDADPIFGTAYRTQTNIDQGRDVVSTLAIVPDPNGTVARQVKKSDRPVLTPNVALREALKAAPARAPQGPSIMPPRSRERN